VIQYSIVLLSAHVSLPFFSPDFDFSYVNNNYSFCADVIATFSYHRRFYQKNPVVTKKNDVKSMATKKKDAKITASSHSFFPILFCVTGRKKNFFLLEKLRT